MGHNHNDSHNTKLQILIQPKIGLVSDVHGWVVEIPQQYFGEQAVQTLKIRHTHWNVSGADSFKLHFLFDSELVALEAPIRFLQEDARNCAEKYEDKAL